MAGSGGKNERSPKAKRPQYRAPALEKGLDVLHLLSDEPVPITISTICQRLARSQGEMFRMVQVLESRGFIAQDPETGGYTLTDMLFSMAMRQPATQSLVEMAIPAMRRLVSEIGQSCHLAMHSRGDIVVVARMESVEQIGFTVRVGYRRSVVQTVSGLTLFAFQPEEVRQQWLAMIEPAPNAQDRDSFVRHADKVREAGYAQAPSSFVKGVTDVSAPIMRGDRAAAALTVPYIKTVTARGSIADVARHLRSVAAEISGRLILGDSRA